MVKVIFAAAAHGMDSKLMSVDTLTTARLALGDDASCREGRIGRWCDVTRTADVVRRLIRNVELRHKVEIQFGTCSLGDDSV